MILLFSAALARRELFVGVDEGKARQVRRGLGYSGLHN